MVDEEYDGGSRSMVEDDGGDQLKKMMSVEGFFLKGWFDLEVSK